MLTLLNIKIFFLVFCWIFLSKRLSVQKIVLPLHSLSGSNHGCPTEKHRWSLTTFHTDKQYNNALWIIQSKEISKERKRTVNNLTYNYSGQYKQFQIDYVMPWYYILRHSTDTNLQRRVWSWLRMNASYRLNTCKSRGLNGACFSETTGARVSNAYPTCPSYWYSLPKGRLIPNAIS